MRKPPHDHFSLPKYFPPLNLTPCLPTYYLYSAPEASWKNSLPLGRPKELVLLHSPSLAVYSLTDWSKREKGTSSQPCSQRKVKTLTMVSPSVTRKDFCQGRKPSFSLQSLKANALSSGFCLSPASPLSYQSGLPRGNHLCRVDLCTSVWCQD